MIYIVVPVFNRKKLLERFLLCLRRQTFRDFQTIVVDDGSTDGTAEMLSEHFNEVTVLHGDGNLWWTGAINVGLKHALARSDENDAILIINDDVEVDEHYLATLDRRRTQMPRTIIGSVVVDHKDPAVIYDGGRTVNWWTAKFRIMNAGCRLSKFSPDHCVDVSFLTGWGTLMPVTVFRAIGLYDDQHFQQCGDTELPVRAKHAGFRLVVSYDAVIKVETEQSDHVNITKTYSVCDLRRYYFGIKSNTRLKYRYYFARNTVKSPLVRLSFIVCDVVRITYHFVSRLRLQPT